VQSYIKSQAGTDGLYLFVDVGAGTVDLSIFIYYTHPSNDRPITYVEAGVPSFKYPQNRPSILAGKVMPEGT